ncbi:KICSTOR complex protein SZT2 isoform X1 [Petromyzon marinus]|uniref:KICSTOR complex protein SZT2 isoform X1 n=2 Tax=Petromyzon marinus TaxID=7757 RepID=UPI003F706EBA
MAAFSETAELENEVLEAGQVYLLMKKQYRISRNMRSAWFFSNLNRIVAPTPLHELESGDGDLLVLSVLPKGWQPGDSPPCGSATADDDRGGGVMPPCRLVPSSHVIFLACRYRFVIALDLSPSTAVVDDWCGEIVFDRVFRTLALCLRRLARPFLVPGTRNLFRPEIFITVLAYSPFMASGSQQVLVQGCRLDRVHLPSFLHDVRVQLMRFEGHVAEFLQKQREPMMAQDDGDAPISPPPLPSSPTGPTAPAPLVRPPPSVPPLGAGVARHLAEPVVMVTADVGLVSVLRYGVLALQLLPANTSSGIIVITDGVTSIPDINYCDMLLTQLRNSTVACSFLQVGGVFSYDCNFGHVPNVEMMRFIATATGGTYAGPEVFHGDIDDYSREDDVYEGGGQECGQEWQGRRESGSCIVKEEVGTLGDVLLHQQEVVGAGAKSGCRSTGSLAMTAYHRAFLTYSFMEAARGGGVGDMCGAEHRLFNEHLAWASANPALATRRKKHTEREVHAELGSIVSVRLREGYSVRDVALTKGGSQIEVKLVLPWKHNLRIEYCVSAPWPQHRSPPPSSPLLIATTGAAAAAHSLSHCSSTTTSSISSTSSSSSAQASTPSSTTNTSASHFVSTSTAASLSAVTSTTTSTVTSSSTSTSSSSAVAGHSNSTVSSSSSSSLATAGGAGTARGGSAVQPVCLTEVTMEGGYEVLHDITCTMRKPIASPYRMAVVRKFWQTLLGIAQTDQLLVHLQSFSSNPAFYTVPESTRNGVPLFYLPPGSSTPVLSLQQSGLGKDSSHGQFSGYWKPVFSLDVGKLQRWMHLHRIGVLLQHDMPVPRFIHTPNSNGRFATVQSRVAMSALTSLLRTWSSFVLVEANSYVKLVDLPNGSVTFYLVRISAKAPCVVLRLAFPLETPASTRNKVVDDLRKQIWEMSFPQRVLQQPQPQPQQQQQQQPEEVQKGKSKTCLFTESPAASKSSQPPPSSDRPCAVLLTKPVEKLLIRYERAPIDYLSPPAPAPPLPMMQQRQPPLLLAASAAVPGSPCSALAHYFTHRRWVFSVEPLASSNASSTTSPTSSYTAVVMAACTRLLQTLAELRLAEGFNFAASGDGVVSMVTELPMKAECEGKGDCDEVQTCLVQYVLFPPLSSSPRHTFSTDEDGDDDGEDDCNGDLLGSDGEVMLLVSTECWLEPLSGRVSIPPERYAQQSHLDGLCYTDIAHAMHPRDIDCVNTLLTSELLAFLCNNPDAHYATNRAIQPLVKQQSGASTLWHIPFRFDLMCLLPKCRQAEMVFNTYSTDYSWPDSSTTGSTHPSDWLLSLFHTSLSDALSLREIPLDEGDHVTFVKLVLERNRGGHKPLFSMPTQEVESDKQESSVLNASKDSTETTITTTAKGTGIARWRCYAKATGSGHTLVFVPASFTDLQLLLGTNPHSVNPDPVLQASDPVVNAVQTEELVPLPVNPNQDPDQVVKSPVGRPASQDRPHRSSHSLALSRQGSLLEPSPSSNGLRFPVYIYSHSVDSLRETLTRLPAPPCPSSTPDATAAAAEAEAEMSASGGEDMFFWCSSEEGGVDLSSRQHREKELMVVCELVQEVFHQSFMKGLFHCLRRSVAVAASDVLSAIDFCEETLTEVDITAFLQALCGHVRPRASCQSRHSSWEDDGGGDDGDADDEGDDVGDLHTSYCCCCHKEHENLRGGVSVVAEAVETRKNLEPDDGGGDASMDKDLTATMSVLPGSSPHAAASSPLCPHLASSPITSHDDPCQPLPNLHSAIQAKFLEISSRFFKSIPSNPAFFFYCPTSPKKENETQGTKRKSRRFGKAEGVSETEGSTGARTSFSLTESDADIVVEYRDEHNTGGDAATSTWRQGPCKGPDDDDEEDDEELEEEDDDEDDDGDEQKDDNGEVEFSSDGTIDAADRENDFEIDDDDDDDSDGDGCGDNGGDGGDGLPPLFVHLTCSVSVRNQHCSMPVRTLPTCLGEVLGWLEGVDLRKFSLKDLTVTLDIIILTLPLEIEESPLGISHNRYSSENSAFIHRSPAQGSSYRSDEENILHGPLLPSAIAELREGIPTPLSNLTETHRQAVLDTVEEVRWLLRDEVVSALRVSRSTSRRSLASVAAHVSRSRDRPSCLTEHVALQFVFGPDQSMSRFMRELESMDMGQKYELLRSGEFHFVALRETRDTEPSLNTDIGNTTSVEAPSATASGGGGGGVDGGDAGGVHDAASVDGVAVDSRARDGTDAIAAAAAINVSAVDYISVEAVVDGSIVDGSVVDGSVVDPAVDGAANDDTAATASVDTTTTVTTIIIEGSSSNDGITSPTPAIDVHIEDGEESVVMNDAPNSPEGEETLSAEPAASDTGRQCIVEGDTERGQRGRLEDPVRRPPLMPDFWLILRIQPDRVTVFTHSRSLVVSSGSMAHTSPLSSSSSSAASSASSSSLSLSDNEPEFLSVHRLVVKKIAEICRVVNQSLLLQDLHDTRCCNSLLVAESEEDIWKPESAYSSYRHKHYITEDYGADDGYQSKDYLAASMLFMPGHFACDIMWTTIIPVHPRLRMAPSLAGSKGMQSLRSALAAFSVGNRKNMYVYQERSTGAVCYLRLIEESAATRTSFDSNKEGIPSAASLQSPVIASPFMSLTRSQEPTATTDEPVTPRGWWDRQVSIESVSSRTAESSTRAIGHSEKNIRLNVHGVVPAGVEVTGELLKALLRRLHEATLDVITVMLVRNCMLTPADVQFLQPHGQAPSETVLVLMPPMWGPRFPAVLHYLRQNLHTFLLSPKYIDTDPENHFQHSSDKRYSKGEIYLYNKPGGLGTGGKGIACVALSVLAPPADTSESSTEEMKRDPLSDTDLDAMTQVTLVKEGSEVPTGAVFRFSLWETGTISMVQLCERLRAAVLHAVCEAALEFAVLTAPLSIPEPSSSSSSSPTSSFMSSSPAGASSCSSSSPAAAAETSTLTPLSSSSAAASSSTSSLLSPSAAAVGASPSVASSTTQTSPLLSSLSTAVPQATEGDSGMALNVPVAMTSPAPAARSLSNPIPGGTRGSQPPLSPGITAGVSAMPELAATSGTSQGKSGRRSFWEILANKTDSPNASSPKTTDDITSNPRDEVGAGRRRRHKTGTGAQSDAAASPAGSGTTWLHQEIARRQEEEKRQRLEEGLVGVLHPAYMGPCQRWLEFMHHRGCPSVQRCEMELSSRLQVDRFLAETENLVHGAAEDTSVRVYIRDSCGTKWHTYQPFQDMSVTPGLQRKFVILARSIAQWRSSGISSLAHKSLQRFEALDTIGGEKSSDQGGAVHSGKSGQTIAPRQRFLVFSLDDRKLSLHTYNWSSELGAGVMRGTSRLVHWLNARSHLLMCLLSQKMGLFHHYYYGDLPPPPSDPGKQMEPNPFLQPPCEADALIRSSAPPPPKDPTWASPMGPGRGLLVSGSTTTAAAGGGGGGGVAGSGGGGGGLAVGAAPASLELLQLDEALRDVVAPRPMRLAPYGASGDAVTRHGEQYREIRAHERREIEAQCKIENLFITWQQRSAQSNMPITVSELDLLRQSSRLVHYCATPLVFDPAIHLTDAAAANSVPPMVPHCSPPSGTSDIATPTSTTGSTTTTAHSLTPGPAAPAAAAASGGGGGEAWLLELCTAFIQQYVQYLQSLGFILVHLRPSTPARRSSVSTRPRSSAFSVNIGTSDGKPRSQRPWPESSTKAAGGGVSSLMYHLQRALPGGLVLMELGFQRHFFTVKQFALECSRFPVGQSLNPQGFIGLKARMKHYVEGSTISESALSMLFTEECERVRDLMHVHSFSHDFHLRVAHHYLLGRQLTFPRAYALGAFLHRFARAHRSAPKYGRNHLLTGELELSVGGTPAPQLYAYMVEHAHTYGLKPLTMESGPGPCSPGGLALEFALVALSTRSGSYKDADGVRHFDDFDVSLIVRHDTSNLYTQYEQEQQQQPEPQQQQHSDLKLLYCLVMTSCRELFPRLTADMSRFRKLPRSYRPEQQQQLKDQQQQKLDGQQQHAKMKQLQQLQQEQQEQQVPQQLTQQQLHDDDDDDDRQQQQQENMKEQQQQRSEACPLLLQQLLRRTDGAAEVTAGPREQHAQRNSRELPLPLPSSTSPSSSSTSSSPPHLPLFPLLASEKESALARIRSVVALARSQCRRDSLWQRLLLAADSTSETHAAPAPMASPSAATLTSASSSLANSGGGALGGAGDGGGAGSGSGGGGSAAAAVGGGDLSLPLRALAPLSQAELRELVEAVSCRPLKQLDTRLEFFETLAPSWYQGLIRLLQGRFSHSCRLFNNADGSVQYLAVLNQKFPDCCLLVHVDLHNNHTSMQAVFREWPQQQQGLVPSAAAECGSVLTQHLYPHLEALVNAACFYLWTGLL